MISTLTAAKLTATVSLLTAPAPTVSITAPGHAPKIKTHWNYTVHVTSAGKPVAGKLTEMIVDPVGGVHPVDLGSTTTKIANRPVAGTFSDYIIWPAASRGIPLTLRITVQVGGTKTTIAYHVTPVA